MHRLSNMFLDPLLFEKGRQVLFDRFSSTWRARYHHLRVNMLFAVDCSTVGVTLEKSGDAHPDAGRRMFAARLVGMGSIVGYCYGLLVYENLRSSRSRFERYVGCIIKLTRKTFLRWTNRFPEIATDRSMVHHLPWIVRDSCCTICFANDGKRLPGAEAPEDEKLRHNVDQC